MDGDRRAHVAVSQRIAAPAAGIFRVLAAPANHPALDGSGMLRGARDRPVLRQVGDTFTTAMYLQGLGDYLMLNRVIAFEQDRLIVWEPTPGDAVASENAELPIGVSQGYSYGFQLQPEGDMTIVTEIFDCTDAAQGVRDAVQDGQVWLQAMHLTLERLATLVEQKPSERDPTVAEDYVPVSVTRRIGAPADLIFPVLADPGQHPDIDGSGMLRGGGPFTAIAGVGDVFTMKMHNSEWGDYLMDNHVVEFEVNRRIAWQPRPGHEHPEADSAPEAYRWVFDLVSDGPHATLVTETYDCSNASAGLRAVIKDGRRWTDSMTRTLERLDALCTARAASRR